MGERKGTKGLELWCRRVTEGYPGVQIQNMTKSWRDGLAFCAIIHHFRPDLLDFSKLNKDDIYHNNELAFRVAEEYLGIPALLEPGDMVKFEVPDRLSILTYLAQFFQAFGDLDGSRSRIGATKRSASAAERPKMSQQSSSPPTKIAAPIIGRPRREPCAKCGSPVFIAERLNVGKHLFHRTCFRCARCNSQLNLSNYYETEIDKQYCCETCPDEENVASPTKAFDPEKNSLLSRSLSDEEKTAGLLISEDNDNYSELFETALENDLSAEKVDTLSRSSTFTQAMSQFINSQIEGEDALPSLPSSKPPIITVDLNEHSINVNIDSSDTKTNCESADSGLPSNSRSLDSDIVSHSISDTNQLADSKLDNESIDTKDISETLPFTSTPFVKKQFEPLLDPKLQMDTLDSSEITASATEKNTRSDSISNDLVVDKDAEENHDVDEIIANSIIELSSDSDCAILDDSGILEVAEVQAEIIELDDESAEKISSADNTNPFDDEEDDEFDVTSPVKDTRKVPLEKEESYPEDLNPFDDEDIPNETLVPIPTRRKKIALREKISLNPFDDDCHGEAAVPGNKRKISAPKVSLTPIVSTLRGTSELKDYSLYEAKSKSGSTSNSKDSSPYGSNNSISATSSVRMKKPAPKPPISTLNIPKATTSSSTPNSPRTTPKYKKNKKAPAPPSPLNNNKIDATVKMRKSESVEKDKENKDVINENRRSIILNKDEKRLTFSAPDKSTYGKWKRKKGPAPPKPQIPQKRTIKCVPFNEVKRELDIIEFQQQGLERQGVRLEQIIRDKCEGDGADSEDGPVTIEVEDLILQLFEVVNEKNELCRKQAEFMYIQRQQRLEEEHAEIEYQIRCLIIKPEANKTDYDKAKEEELIERLVKVVEKRNEIIECLEMDRIREADEDLSINTHLNNFTMKRDEGKLQETTTLKTSKKKSKKEKKSKSKNLPKFDIDKDIDETEVSKNHQVPEKVKQKKKKKFNLF